MSEADHRNLIAVVGKNGLCELLTNILGCFNARNITFLTGTDFGHIGE